MFALIETKKPGEGQDKGESQLGVWLCAFFSKIESLREELGQNEPSMTAKELPWIPLFLVQGPSWYFYAAYKTEESIQLCRLIGDPVGSTDNAFGLVRLFAVLELVADWGGTKYQTWFDRTILLR